MHKCERNNYFHFRLFDSVSVAKSNTYVYVTSKKKKKSLFLGTWLATGLTMASAKTLQVRGIPHHKKTKMMTNIL